MRLQAKARWPLFHAGRYWCGVADGARLKDLLLVFPGLFVRSIMTSKRDVEKTYSDKEFVEKLRRLADAIEKGEKFEIQIAGERIYVPVRANYNIEHEREGRNEEIEFQMKWTNEDRSSS
jgi:amphi-Trp domain-containing protein